MSKLFKPSTRKALQFYGLLALSAFLVPKNFVTYNQFVFTFIIVAYVFGWYRVLRYLWFRSNSNDDKYRWDFLVYDLIYILGLPIILNIMMIKVGRPLFVLKLRRTAIFYFWHAPNSIDWHSPNFVDVNSPKLKTI